MRLFYTGVCALVLLSSAITASAKHVKGGFIQYTCNGAGSSSGTANYTITVTVFFSCTAQGPRDNVYLGIFNASSGASVAASQLSIATSKTVTKTTFNPCMSDPPSICYEIYTYVYTADLPVIAAGYILAVQDAYRTDGIINISNSSGDGITITAQIPGTIGGTDYHANNSPSFAFLDTAIICYNGQFSYPFKATDPDGDSLSYSFGNGLNVSNASQNTSQTPPGNPPYPSLTYLSGYSGQLPLGSGVTIDPVTGNITGKAPATTGEYVIAVYVKEWRKGVLIDSVKKELQIYVYNCSLSAASLETSYINCDNFTFTFENQSTSSNITSYAWDFGVPNSTTDVSADPTPTYTYPAAGTYTLKLKVSNSSGCTDSAESPVKVYPGFAAAFAVTGSCYQSPFQFRDQTTAKYGTVNGWSWNFGDPSSTTDVSSVQNPSYQYPAPATATVTLIATSSEGCRDTATKTVTVSGKPQITLPFTDTLICSIDSLQLSAESPDGETFVWTPDYNIYQPGTANPIVYPKDTTTYTVTVTDKGCVDSAKVTVNVLDYITVSLTADTTICATDSIRMNPTSYALKYAWSPSDGLSAVNVKYPNAAPSENTSYTVVANLGKCQATASEYVKVVPYPVSDAGADTTICYGAFAQLTGTISGSSFTWTPDSSLSGAATLTPVASPTDTTAYVLAVGDNKGCPKIVRDTVWVNVTPQIRVFAGNDTSVVVDQPLQLNATANDGLDFSWAWAPTDWLSSASVADPVALVTSSTVDSITYRVTATTAAGCSGSDDIKVIVFKTLPDIFMPSAFTPNGDGRNDVYRPILVGMSKLDYFRIYNRWGGLVFSTSQPRAGWDGTLLGQTQDTGTFVYMVRGETYQGKTIEKKGTFVLIR